MSQQRFAVFDIDGTIFRWQLYHELFDALIDDGVISRATSEPVLAAREQWRQRALRYTEYEQILIGVMEAAIIGLDEKRFHAIADAIMLEKGHHVYRYTLELLKRLKTQGYVIIAISGSHQELVDRFSALHGIDISIGRQYETMQGKLTGKSELVYGHKKELLVSLVEQHDLSWDESYAIGDSTSDTDMLELVSHPIAFNPNEGLREDAMRHGLPMVIERKSLSYRLEKGKDGTYILAETTTL